MTRHKGSSHATSALSWPFAGAAKQVELRTRSCCSTTFGAAICTVSALIQVHWLVRSRHLPHGSFHSTSSMESRASRCYIDFLLWGSGRWFLSFPMENVHIRELFMKLLERYLWAVMIMNSEVRFNRATVRLELFQPFQFLQCFLNHHITEFAVYTQCILSYVTLIKSHNSTRSMIPGPIWEQSSFFLFCTSQMTRTFQERSKKRTDPDRFSRLTWLIQ